MIMRFKRLNFEGHESHKCSAIEAVAGRLYKVRKDLHIHFIDGQSPATLLIDCIRCDEMLSLHWNRARSSAVQSMYGPAAKRK